MALEILYDTKGVHGRTWGEASCGHEESWEKKKQHKKE